MQIQGFIEFNLQFPVHSESVLVTSTKKNSSRSFVRGTKTASQLFTSQPVFLRPSVHERRNKICKFSVALIQPSNKFPLHLQLQSESNIYRTFETVESFSLPLSYYMIHSANAINWLHKVERLRCIGEENRKPADLHQPASRFPDWHL